MRAVDALISACG